MDWFKYTGSGSIYDPLNYMLIAIPDCPSPKLRLCAIYASRQILNSELKPVFTGLLQAEIATVIMTKQESVNVLLCP
ncbi:hypothetical protein [Pedobacter antarcticus]|uniref:hypothetical protein n=1 Tax=Pedobacter antarcticus TaxID=34086 RepID=UPI001C57CCB0|nr:hypothetical protein [Pedobacter antarcticus]